MYMYHTGFFFKGDVPSWPMEDEHYCIYLSGQIVVGQAPLVSFHRHKEQVKE